MHSPASDWMVGSLAFWLKRPGEREGVVMDFPINRIPAGGTAALFISVFPPLLPSWSISGTFGQQIPTPVRLAMTELQRNGEERLSRPYNVLKM